MTLNRFFEIILPSKECQDISTTDGEVIQIIQYEFSFEVSGETLKVVVNTDCYKKTAGFALELGGRLVDEIPFAFRTRGEIELAFLGGERRRKMLSVEMVIVPTQITVAEAVEKLVANGFHHGLEPTLA